VGDGAARSPELHEPALASRHPRLGPLLACYYPGENHAARYKVTRCPMDEINDRIRAERERRIGSATRDRQAALAAARVHAELAARRAELLAAHQALVDKARWILLQSRPGHTVAFLERRRLGYRAVLGWQLARAESARPAQNGAFGTSPPQWEAVAIAALTDGRICLAWGSGQRGSGGPLILLGEYQGGQVKAPDRSVSWNRERVLALAQKAEERLEDGIIGLFAALDLSL
jgi:hypothetical protein